MLLSRYRIRDMGVITSITSQDDRISELSLVNYRKRKIPRIECHFGASMPKELDKDFFDQLDGDVTGYCSS